MRHDTHHQIARDQSATAPEDVAPRPRNVAAAARPDTPGVYIHVPFCRTKCTYCAFVSGDYDEHLASEYLPALEREIRDAGGLDGRPPVDTIFFGGGTPSLLPAAELAGLLAAVRGAFDVAPDAEITVEMNPGTLTPEKLATYRSVGVNRASVGVQSFDDDELRSIGRVHSADEARAAVRMLRDAGFDNVSLDLIAGLPNQAREVWRNNLDEAIALEPDHLSLYLLELHPGTKLARDVDAGRTERPDDDLAATMYFDTVDRLRAAGFVHYEISNFAQPTADGDARSRHNEKYWLDAPYYGFGVSAHGYVAGERRSNSRNIKAYADAMHRSGTAVVERNALTLRERATEAAFLGLRRLEGIDLEAYASRYAIDLLNEFADGLEPLFDAGLVETVGGRLRLTRRGLVLSNEVFQAFL